VTTDSIIGLIISMVGGVVGLVYFLNNSIKKTLEEVGKKIDTLSDSISTFKQAFAARSAEIDYIKSELEVIKRRCWDCEQRFHKKGQ
jgi:prefoldin subunit 5